MVLVGICGQISSGKSTFAELLTAIDPAHSVHMETSGLVVELGNTFNASLYARRGRLQKEAGLIPLANESIKALLPQLSAMAGSEIAAAKVLIDEADVQAHPDWYEKLFLYLSQVRQMTSIAATQITYDNKSNYRPLLQWIGGYFLYKLDNRLLWYEELLRRVKASGPEITLAVLTAPRQPSEAEFVQNAGGAVLKIERPGLLSDTSDVTERQVADIKPDSVIINNGTLIDLEATARKVHKALMQGTLRSKYNAREVIG